MNKIIILIVQGTEYNKTFKWNSAEEFKEALESGDGLPNPQDIVIEAYIDDNIVDIGNTFSVTSGKLEMILGL